MTQPTPIRSEDGKHLNGSIGVGKDDVPTPGINAEVPATAKAEEPVDLIALAKARFDAASASSDSTPVADDIEVWIANPGGQVTFATPEEIAAGEEKYPGIEVWVSVPAGIVPQAPQFPAPRPERVSRRYSFERFADFKTNTINATEALLAKHPSQLTPDARTAAFQEWVDTSFAGYVNPDDAYPTPTVAWSSEGHAPRFDSFENTIYLNPDKPRVVHLLEAFRVALLERGLGVSPMAPRYTIEDFLPTECPRCFEELDWNQRCGDCGTVFNQPSETQAEVDLMNHEIDAKAWARSLYYQTKPELFTRMAIQGKLGRSLKREVGERYPDLAEAEYQRVQALGGESELI